MRDAVPLPLLHTLVEERAGEEKAPIIVPGSAVVSTAAFGVPPNAPQVRSRCLTRGFRSTLLHCQNPPSGLLCRYADLRVPLSKVRRGQRIAHSFPPLGRHALPEMRFHQTVQKTAVFASTAGGHSSEPSSCTGIPVPVECAAPAGPIPTERAVAHQICQRRGRQG